MQASTKKNWTMFRMSWKVFYEGKIVKGKKWTCQISQNKFGYSFFFRTGSEIPTGNFRKKKSFFFDNLLYFSHIQNLNFLFFAFLFLDLFLVVTVQMAFLHFFLGLFIYLYFLSRWLVKKGELTRLIWRDLDAKLTFGKRISKHSLFFFLFTDLLVVTKRKSEESYTGGGWEWCSSFHGDFLFYINCGQSLFTVYARSALIFYEDYNFLPTNSLHPSSEPLPTKLGASLFYEIQLFFFLTFSYFSQLFYSNLS